MSYTFNADLGLISMLLSGKSMRVSNDNLVDYCDLVAGTGMPTWFGKIRIQEAILNVLYGTMDTVWRNVLWACLEKYDLKDFRNKEWVRNFVTWFAAFRDEMDAKIMELNVPYERA